MSSQDNDQDFRAAVGIVIFSVLLAVGIAVGVGIYKIRGNSPAAPVAAPVSTQPVALVAPAAEAVVPAAASVPVVVEAAVPEAPVVPDANGSVVVDNGVVKFYFAKGSAELPTGAVSALQTAIAAAKSGKRLLVAGYHDATGSRSRNTAVAKQRALSVRAALVGAGVAEKQVQLRKPEQSIGSGDAAQARRVEVTIID